MPKGSRRLPGGRVRKPLARQPGRPAAPVAAEPLDERPEDGVLAASRPPSRPATSTTQDARPTLTTPAARPSAPPATAAARFRAAQGVAQAQRRGPSVMDLTAANYTHIRADLARIGILAAVMFGVIFALSFVLK
jgi:hypothetical protein